MTAEMVRLALVAGMVLSGWASQYAPGMMEQTVENRQHIGHLPQSMPRVDGFAATASCDLVGHRIYARPEGSEKWDILMVADCSGSAETSEWMRNQGGDPILVEVGYQTVTRWEMTPGRGMRIEARIYREIPRYKPE